LNANLTGVSLGKNEMKGANFRGADLTIIYSDSDRNNPNNFMPQYISCKKITDAGAIIDNTTKCLK